MSDPNPAVSPTNATLRHADKLQQSLRDDLADLRGRLSASGTRPGDAEGEVMLAELHESICRLVSELQAAEEPNNQTGTIHG